MTRRPLLWIAASAAVLGAVAVSPSAAGADPLSWAVTVDDGTRSGVVASRDLVVAGEAAYEVALGVAASADNVTVTVTPLDLPEACGPALVETGPVTDGRYEVPVRVRCNGPHEIKVQAHTGLGSSDPKTRLVGMAEPPARPDPPETAPADGGVVVSWTASPDLDSAGWELKTAAGNQTYAAATTQVLLPPELRGTSIALSALRWGAEGQGSTVASAFSTSKIVTGVHDRDQHTPPVEPPAVELPGVPAPKPEGARPAGLGASPPTAGPQPSVPSPGSTSTLPEGYTEELPFGTPDDAFVPSDEPSPTAASDDDGRAATPTSPSAGLVRTTEKRPPGLVAPFALGLLMITIAAHIAWYLRRSRPSGPGAAPSS